MSRDTLNRLKDPTLVALCINGDAWPRGLLSETPIPDTWMGLVEKSDGRRRFVPAGEDPGPDHNDRLLLVRNRLITVPLDLADYSASDGHAVDGTCELFVRWEARDDDLAALRKSLMTQEDLTLERLAEALAEAGGKTALQRFIGAHPAKKLVREDLRSELLKALREQLQRFLFETGMLLDRVAKLQFSSDSLTRQETLQRQTVEQVERIKSREMVEQAALAATHRRLDDLRGVLAKLQNAAADDSQVQWHDLLPVLSSAERGRLLENLWRLTPDRHTAQAIVVAAGNECIWLDPAEPERIVRRVTLDESLGGLRSVTLCPQGKWLLVGAALGVWTVAAADGEICGRYEVPEAGEPRTGFNAATIAGHRLFATHSQLGCWSWPLNQPAEGRVHLRPIDGVPKAVRGVSSMQDGRVVFAGDDCVHILDAEGERLGVLGSAGATVHALAVLESLVFVGTAQGTLLRHDLDGAAGWTTLHRGMDAIESVRARRWNDLVELVVPGGAQGVCGVYAEEGFVGRLLESSTPIRRAWACDDLVVGLNDRRDRLVLINANLPERSVREAPVARMIGHRIQDACIVSSVQSAPA